MTTPIAMPGLLRSHFSFTPTPNYWWDARVTANITQSSNLVTVWKDTQAAIQLTNSGGATRPDYLASNTNLNNLATVGTGVQTTQLVQCAAAAFTIAVPYTILLLAYWPNPGGATNHYAFDAGQAGSQRALYMVSSVGHLWNGTADGPVTGTGIFTAQKHAVACVFNTGANASKIYVDSYTTATSGTFASLGSLGGFTFGNYLGGGGFAGGLQASQVMIVSGALSGATLQNYMTYLALLGNITLV